MPGLTERSIGCPYCGERISVLVDGSIPEQNYIEDCEVCCQPIVVEVNAMPDEDPIVNARDENT